jgi:hypothetical protein
MPDPFPDDRCVPPKGVDCGHYGYVRTSWRVLIPKEPDCCLDAVPCCEPIPAGTENVDFHAILEETDGAESLSITPIGSKLAGSDSGYIHESVDVVRQAFAGGPSEATKRR